MPILPENKRRYPKNWKEIRERILTRAGQIRDDKGKVIQEAACEWKECGVKNHSIRNGKKIVLTIAHLDHTPENCEDDNLKAWCQLHHNRYDIKNRVRNRKLNKLKKELTLCHNNIDCATKGNYYDARRKGKR